MSQKPKVDTPYRGSWAEQEKNRPRVEVSEEEKRMMRAGLVHPDIRNAVPLDVGKDGADVLEPQVAKRASPDQELGTP